MNNNPMCEDAPCCGCCGIEHDNNEGLAEYMEQAGWPGDGSGEDDFADYNANEADDYRDEGNEDAYLDASYEDRTDLGDFGD